MELDVYVVDRKKGVSFMKRFLSFLFVILLVSAVAFAGTTGKIRGKVVDASTGEGLPGATVLVEGTQLGAAASADGSFFILQVPPGVYSLQAVMVGYSTGIVTDVVISADSTTNVTIELQEKIAGTEEVTVTAKREIIRKDNTSTVEKVDAAKIKNMAVDSVDDVLTIQKGAALLSNATNNVENSANEERGNVGGLHIRGGRGNEVGYYVNGFSVQNLMTGQSALDVATDAVQEMQILTGGFNAEYGNAMSGIINIVTKEGGKDFHAGVTVETDAMFSKPDKVDPGLLDLNYGFNSIKGFVSGPIPYTPFAFMGTFGYSERDAVGHRIPDYEDMVDNLPEDLAPAYWTPHTAANGYDYQFKLSGKLMPTLKSETDILGSFSQGEYYSHRYKYDLDKYMEGETNSLLITEKLTHTLNARTFYSVMVGYFDFTDDWLPQSGEDEIGDFINPYTETDERVFDLYNLFYIDGHYIAFSQQEASYINVRGDLTSQVNRFNQIKAGFEVQMHDLEYFSCSYPTSANYTTDFNVKPMLANLFVQDKLEYENMILNVGVRMDYFDPNIKYFTDPTAFIEGTDSPTADADAKYAISPRIGLALPISDTSVLHFHYGYFYQMPTFNYLFSNVENDEWYKPGYPLLGNPNLDMQKTIAYELGLEQRLGEDWRMTVVGYYKSISDLLYTEEIPDPIKSYTLYTNGGYAQVRGLEIGLSKLYSNYISGDINYSLSWATGNSSSERDGYYGVVTVSGGLRTPPAKKYPLAFDRRHAVKINMDIRTQKGDGPELFGMKPLQNAGVNFLFSYESGAPYTPKDVTNRNTGPMNSMRMPGTKSLDMRINKDFEFDVMGRMLNVSAYCTISNLFNWVNVTSVYATTGEPDDNGLYDNAAAATDPYPGDDYTFENKYKEYFGANPEFYGAPRYVRFGLGISF